MVDRIERKALKCLIRCFSLDVSDCVPKSLQLSMLVTLPIAPHQKRCMLELRNSLGISSMLNKKRNMDFIALNIISIILPRIKETHGFSVVIIKDWPYVPNGIYIPQKGMRCRIFSHVTLIYLSQLSINEGGVT